MSEDELSDSYLDEKENRGNVERLLKRIKELEDEKLKMKNLLKENEGKKVKYFFNGSYYFLN